MSALTLLFQKEKETKNTVKYQEVPEKGRPPVIGALYIQKWAAQDAQTVSVTLNLEA